MPSAKRSKTVEAGQDVAAELRASLLKDSASSSSKKSKLVKVDETNLIIPTMQNEEEAAAPPEADEEELMLKAALFGERIPEAILSKAQKKADEEDIDHTDAPDDSLFKMDAEGEEESEDEDGTDRRKAGKAQVAWQDSDDEELEVDLSQSARLRKLRKEEDETVVKGDVYSQRLREQHEKLFGKADWAQLNHETEEVDDEEEALLKHRSTLIDKKRRRQGTDRTGKIILNRMKDANAAEYSKCVIRALDWHQGSPELMLTGGMDKTLRLFRVDGDKNAKIQSVHFSDLPIYAAKFSGPSSVVLSGRRPFFYSYDLESGALRKINGIFGREPREKSLEMFEASQDHDTLAFVCRDGFISLVSKNGFKEIGAVRMAGGVVRTLSFYGSTGLMASGDDGELCKWDLRNTSRPVWRRRDEGSLSGRSLACNKPASIYASGSNSGVVNIYKDDENGTKLKTVMNLTTSVDSSAFSDDGRFLCLGSSRKRDQVRIVHIPTGQVVVNWPNAKVPLAHVSKVSFSHRGDMLAVGNDRGKVLLWKIQGGAITS